MTALREQRILALRIITESVIVISVNAALLPFIGLYGVAVEIVATYAWRVWLTLSRFNQAYPDFRVTMGQIVRLQWEDVDFTKRVWQEAFRSIGRPFRALGKRI